jgi:nucleotidyltransferase substrate binding protein (TIGR01987 family)
VKEFEIILELAGKFLRKALKDFVAIPRSVDALVFKDVFRTAVLHGILSAEECEHWLRYRDSRNATAHDYGESIAEETLALLPDFARDAEALSAKLRKHQEASK